MTQLQNRQKLQRMQGRQRKKATTAATDTVSTTVKNTTDVQNNPATKRVKEAPIIHQAVEKDPGVTQALGKTTNIVGTSAGNVTDKVTSATGGAVDNAGKGGGKAVDTVDAGAKKAVEVGKGIIPAQSPIPKPTDGKNDQAQQSYTSYAASYLPSVPSWRSPPQKQGTPEPARKPSAPKLERKGSSQVKQSPSRPPPPKLERKGSSNVGNVRSPPPKLGPRKASEPGVKSPLQRVQSGMKSTPGAQQLPNLAENVSGSDAAKQATDTPRQAAQKGGEGLSKVASQGQQAAKKGTDTAGQVASKGQEAATSGVSAVSGAATGAFGGAKKLVGFGG